MKFRILFSMMVLVVGVLLPTEINAQIFGNRTKYQIHEVQPQETAYGISKMYDITLDELYKLNPGAKKGLQIGDRLLIPQKKTPLFGGSKDEYDRYTVQPKETLYSLSKKFGISISELIEMNPELKQGPKIGQEINVPKGSLEKLVVATKDTSQEIPKVDSLEFAYLEIPRIVKPLKNKYKVAVMLPLFLEENDTLMVYNDTKIPKIYKKSEIGIEVLMGIQCAIDSLKKQGLSLDVYMFDTKNSPERCVKLARSPLLKTMDLIIGPLFTTNARPVAGLLDKDSVQVLNMFSKNLELTNAYANVWQATPSEREETMALVRYINKYKKKKNVLIVRQDKPEQQIWAGVAKKYLTPLDSLDSLQIHEIVADSSELAVIDSSHFLPDEDNVVLCLSNDKVFITDVLSKLNVLRMANIQLFGFSDIYELSSPDFDYLMHLKTIIASPYHIDVHNPEVMAFYKNFRETYYSEPSKYSVLAYDMTSHALYQLLHYGSVIGAYGQDDDMGLSMKFRYVRSKKGKLNSRVYLLQYKDYRIMPIIEEKQLNEEPLLEALPQKPKSELDRLKQISFD